jgi:hypothetical protein
MDHKLLMISHPSYHNKFIAISLLVIPLEATGTTQGGEIKSTTVECRVSWLICLLKERIASFKLEKMMYYQCSNLETHSLMNLRCLRTMQN